MKTKILISGANGYIGRHLTRHIWEKTNCDLICLDLKEGELSGERIVYKTIDFLQVAGDTALYNRLGSPDILIHLAWQDGFNHQADSHLINLPKHFAFLKNMIDAGCKNVTVMGSMHEIGFYEGCVDENTPCNPLSMYGIAKNALRQALDVYTRDKAVSFKWLRGFYLTGDDLHNKSVFNKILQLAGEGKSTFPFTSGLNQYDFLDIDELAKQIAAASIQTKINGIINCCSGKPVALRDKVEEFIRSHHLDIRPEYGKYPARVYDSSLIFGSVDKIKTILDDMGNQNG